MKIQTLIVAMLLGSSPQCLMAAPFAYLPSPDANLVSVYDLATDATRSPKANTLLTTLPTQAKPVAVAPNRAGTFVYVVNSNSNSITIVDSSINQVVGTIPTGSKPISAATSRDDKKLYVANSGDNTISVIDTEKGSLIKTLATASAPSRLLVTQSGRLLVLCPEGHSLQAYDTVTEKPLFTIDTESTPGVMTSFRDQAVYIATLDGKILNWDVSTPTKITRLTDISIAPGTNGALRPIAALAAYEPGSKLYAALADGTVVVIDTFDPKVTSQFQIRTTLVSPSGVQVTQDNANAVVTDSGSTSIAAISTSENQVAYKKINNKTSANGNFLSAPAFQMAEAVYAKDEGNNSDSWNTVSLTIKRTGNASGKGKVSYQTESGTAFTKWDFVETKGDIEFNEGETSKQVTVQIIGEQSFEPDEAFTFRLSSAKDGHDLGPQETSQIIILNDDKDPTTGCSIGSKGPADPTLPALSVAALAYGWQRRKLARRADLRQ